MYCVAAPPPLYFVGGPSKGLPVLHVDVGGQAEGLLEAGDEVVGVNGHSVLGLTMSNAAAFVVNSKSVVMELIGSPNAPQVRQHSLFMVRATFVQRCPCAVLRSLKRP